jgi:hypothetical protein
MHNQSFMLMFFKSAAMRCVLIAFVFSIAGLFPRALGQQDYVGRYDAYVGYAYLNSPMISLAEHGVHIQAGTRLRSWVSLGLDYTVANGPAVITPDLLPTALQQTLGAQLGQLAAAGRLPAGYALKVPIHSDTQSMTYGTQFAYHGIKAVTLFLRPGLGAIREVATPHPTDPIATAIVAQLTPAGKKTDWTYYYGVGGGFEVNLNNHVSIRTSVDFVRDHLFNDLLANPRNTVRFAIGPGFQWGRNVMKK